MKRPMPPASVLSNPFGVFVPAPEFEVWSRQFLDDDGLLTNPDHVHLQSARIGFLWTNVEATRQMMPIVGYAEIPTPPPSGGKWSRARFEYQIAQWFGDEPLDFLITLYAPFAAECDDLTFCSLFEHELYHCGQRDDEFGEPKFRKDGTPVYGIRGHDVEEHVGIIRRYGARGGAGATEAFIEAAKRKPEVGAAQIAGACGTCPVLVGIRKLALAVIANAVHEARCDPVSRRRSGEATAGVSALEWLRSQELIEPWCTAAEISPARLKRRIAAITLKESATQLEA